MTSNIVFSEKKQKDMEWAKGIVSRIEADRRKFVKYKDSRQITDIKHMIETSYTETTRLFIRSIKVTRLLQRSPTDR